MQKRLFLSVIAVLAVNSIVLNDGLAQLPASMDGDAMAIPLQPVDNSVENADNRNDPFPGSAASRPSYSSVSALQAKEEPVATREGKDYFLLTLKDTNLQGHSRRKARAVSISMKNTQPFPLEIIQGQVVNGLDEMTVSEEHDHRAQEIKQQAMNFLMRGSNMVSGFGVISANNYGASSTMAPTPAMNFAGSGNVNTSPADEVTGQFVNQFRDVILHPGDTYTFKALIPAGTNPQLKMTFKDLKTGQVIQF